MERFFYRRGQRIVVEHLDDVVAVRDEGAATTDRGAVMAGDDAGDGAAIAPETLGIGTDQAEALIASGWRMMPAFDATRAERGARDADRDGSAQVYLDGDRVLLGRRELVVKLDQGLSDDEARTVIDNAGLSIIRVLRFAPNTFEVRIGDGADLLDVANGLQEREDVIYAEPSMEEHIGQRLTPTDPTYAQQWHLNNTGGGGAVAGADISAEEAWDYTTGAGVRIAVIDNGFDVGHDDLADGIVDESGFFNGAGDFVQGTANYPDDDHGTFCAGMAGARQNNGTDGSGSAPDSELLLLASLVDQLGSQATLARAVAYAADPRTEIDDADPSAGADVIVCSLGPSGAVWNLTSVLDDALVFAARWGRAGRGCPVLWAASNSNVDVASDEVVSHPDVSAVSRSRNTDLEDNSARGDEIEFLAPGRNVVSTASGGGTRTDSGTSFAAPLAAGVGALVLSINPHLSALDVRQILRSSCDKIGGVAYDDRGHHPDYGHGRVNAFRAVTHALQTLVGNDATDLDIDADGDHEIQVTSAWGIGTLGVSGGSLTSVAMEPNGTRFFGGWLLNTADNRIGPIADFDGDDRAEIFVSSPWGIGLLDCDGGNYRAKAMVRNGTRIGGWLVNTADNTFGPVGDFDGDGRVEMVVRSPWGMAVLRYFGGTWTQVMIARNGTRFGGWLLNTADNRIGPVGDFDGDGRDEILVQSPWGLGLWDLQGSTFDAPAMVRNGRRVDGWIVNTEDNVFGPVGVFGPAGGATAGVRRHWMVSSPWGLGRMGIDSGGFVVHRMDPNGTRFGGWLLNTADNRLHGAADLDGDGRDELLISSPWGIGVLELDGAGRLDSLLLEPNGTRFGGWLLNTADNRIRAMRDMSGGGRAEVLVTSPWGIGIWRLDGTSFDAPIMAPNGTWFGSWRYSSGENELVA
jgi:subtilisin family serine protease